MIRLPTGLSCAVTLIILLSAVPALADAPSASAGAPQSKTSSSAPQVQLAPVDVRLIEEGMKLPIDLPTALALAGARNLDLLIARSNETEARALRFGALAEFAPEPYGSLLVFGQRTSGQTQGLFVDLGQPLDRATAATGAQLAINPARALFDALAAHRSARAAMHQTVEVEQETLAQAAVRYFLLERAQAEVKIADDALRASREFARLARDREVLGAGLKADVARAEAESAADELRLAHAGMAMRQTSIELALVLNLESQVMLLPSQTVIRQRDMTDTAGPVPTLLARALANRPAILAEHERVSAEAEHRNAAWADAIAPELYANLQENTVGPSSNRQFYVGRLGLRVSLASIGDAWAAGARLTRVELEERRLHQRVAAEVLLARDRARTAAEQVTSALAGLRAADAAYEISQERFHGGVGLGLEVLQAQAALTEAKSNLVGTIVAYNVAQVELLRALGLVSAEAILSTSSVTP